MQSSTRASAPSTSHVIEVARYYAKQGWRIIPLNWVKSDGTCSCGHDDGKHATGKHPWLAQWPVRASTDEAVWGAWWRERPQSQLGIATGEASDLWVLDIDGPVGVATLQRLEDEHGPLPPTWLVRTGSGGLHFYFRWPKNLNGRVFTVDAGVFPGVDYRGNGGQVVAPPSVNKKGAYTVEEQAEVAYAPDWLVDLLAKEPPRKVEYVPAALNGEGIDRRVQAFVLSCCAKVAAAPGGTRNKTLYSSARAAAEVVAAHGTMTEGQVQSMFLSAAESAGLEAREARITFQSGWDDGQAKPKYLEERPVVRSGGWRRMAEPPVLDVPPPDDVDAPVAVPPAPPSVDDEEYGGGDEDPGMPHIQINARSAKAVIEECWALFEGKRVPLLFRQDGRLVECLETEHGRKIQGVSATVLRAMLGEQACFVKVFERKDGRSEEHAGAAPTWIPEGMEARPRQSLPVLESVVSAPFFGEDGVLVDKPGYHPQARCWLEQHGVKVESMGLGEAKKVIDDWLVDFSFAEESDRINAVALFLLPFVRRLVKGPTPGHLVEASTAGSGKGLLTKILLLPSLGKPPEATAFSDSEDERRKAILAALLGGRPVLMIDNLKGKVDSPALEGVLTATMWQDRQLGSSSTRYVANKATWVLTGNNAELSLDMARRCLRIRLDQGVERPYEQDVKKFRHPDIERYTLDNRSKLVSAAVAMVRAWQASPVEGVKTLGSFESWSEVVGGILQRAGYPGWLENRDVLFRLADRQGDQMRTFVGEWAKKYAGAPKPPSTGMLVALAEEHDLFAGTLGDGSERSKATRFGAMLSKARGRVFSFVVGREVTNWKIPESIRGEGGTTWELIKVLDRAGE